MNEQEEEKIKDEKRVKYKMKHMALRVLNVFEDTGKTLLELKEKKGRFLFIIQVEVRKFQESKLLKCYEGRQRKCFDGEGKKGRGSVFVPRVCFCWGKSVSLQISDVILIENLMRGKAMLD